MILRRRVITRSARSRRGANAAPLMFLPPRLRRQLPSKRLQIFDEVALLLRGETQAANPSAGSQI